MEYPNLKAALDQSASTLQELLKTLVPKRSGSLSNSIVLKGSVDGTNITLSIDLNNYWKYICSGSRKNKEPVPVDEILDLSPTIMIKRYKSLNEAIRVIIDKLTKALEKDIEKQLQI